MKRKIPALILTLTLLSGCMVAPPASPGLTLERLQNGTFLAPVSGRTITLEDGHYASGSDAGAADFLQVSLGDWVVFGKLNEDNLEDAVLLLAENMGGTGVFVSLIAVLNQGDGTWKQASVFLDDRPMVNSLAIQSGEVLADLVLHRAEDPMCCPSWQVERGYRLFGDALVLTRLASETPSGSLRSIDITAPQELEEVWRPIAIRGSVTIGPFENTLAYNVYDKHNFLITAGSVMTDSAEMGLPGNFSLSLDTSLAGMTGWLRIELVEYSMEDGSIMTLDSVLVNLR